MEIREKLREGYDVDLPKDNLSEKQEKKFLLFVDHDPSTNRAFKQLLVKKTVYFNKQFLFIKQKTESN